MPPHDDCFHRPPPSWRPHQPPHEAGHQVPHEARPDWPHDYHHPPFHRPCHYQRGPYSQEYYKYTAIAVTSCGITALLVIMWIYCRRRGGGRVIAQPAPPPEPVKLSPPPYAHEYQNPPSYNDCVPDNNYYRQEFASGSQRVEVSGPGSGVNATAPPRFPPRPPPVATHVVDMPEFSKDRPRY